MSCHINSSGPCNCRRFAEGKAQVEAWSPRIPLRIRHRGWSIHLLIIQRSIVSWFHVRLDCFIGHVNEISLPYFYDHLFIKTSDMIL